MRYILTTIAAVLIMTAPVMAEDIEAPVITIDSAHAFATAPIQKNGAIFLTLHNNGAQDDAVIKASTDVAARTEMHTHIMDGDMMMMREVERYDVPAGGVTTLEPTGHHIMLMGLTAPLTAGETFPLTLTLEKAGEIVVDVSITKPGAAH